MLIIFTITTSHHRLYINFFFIFQYVQAVTNHEEPAIQEDQGLGFDPVVMVNSLLVSTQLPEH